MAYVCNMPSNFKKKKCLHIKCVHIFYSFVKYIHTKKKNYHLGSPGKGYMGIVCPTLIAFL